MTGQPTEFNTAGGLTDGGIVTGNFFDKYSSRNPIVRHLMKGFGDSLENLVSRTGATAIHEVGCGEGYWSIRWASRGMQVRGSDFSGQVIEMARRNAAAQGAVVQFDAADVYDLTAPTNCAELVICCEVLEHLEEPKRALGILARLASPWLIASVPREPIWSLMNMARGKYWSSLGNTPGHVQKWSSKTFVATLQEQVDVIAVEKPMPWTIALCRRRA